MNELIKINQSIAELQKKANLMMSEGRDKTIEEIVIKMKAYEISIKDITVAFKDRTRKVSKTPKFAPKKSSKKSETTKVDPKYRGPQGQLWTGRGLPPKWLKVLLDAGQSKEDFLLKVI